MTKPDFVSTDMATRFSAHALHVGDRINTMGFESEALSAEDENSFLERVKPRIGGRLTRFEEETAIVAHTSEAEDQVQAGGPIQLRDMSPERLLVIADVLAKSVVLAHDEREVTKVFEIIEHSTKELADHGRTR